MKILPLFAIALFAPAVGLACGSANLAGYDANKDGQVTLEEFNAQAAEWKKMQAAVWTQAGQNVNNRLQRQFSNMDVNKDGVIDLNNDFRTLDKVVNGFIDQTESRGKEMAFSDRKDFPKIDANHNNTINFQEYFNYEQSRYKAELAAVNERYSDSKLQKTFSEYDLNKDSVINADEIKKAESSGRSLQKCAEGI